MQLNASKLSSNIIKAHMHNLPLKDSDLKVEARFNFGLYDRDKNAMLTHINHKINFSKINYRTDDGDLIIIDDGVSGHLGIYYVVIQEQNFEKFSNSLLRKNIVTFSFIYFVLALCGYLLAKIFIKPIQNQREKLNNFVKDSTHELNTPITALLMTVNSNKALNQKSLQRIEISAKRISEIYKDLTYLFLKTKEDTLTNKKLNLEKILIAQVEYLKEFVSKKKITIKLETKNVYFAIDEQSFIRVVNNLILNSVKYTQIGGKIDITLTKNHLIVKDNGIGIDEKKLNDIFNRFYRATPTQGGFGIGLSIVNAICETYKIKIEVKSKIKKGTTFMLSFPS